MIFHCSVLDISTSDFPYHFHVVAKGRKEKEALSGEGLITVQPCDGLVRTMRTLEPNLLFTWVLLFNGSLNA